MLCPECCIEDSEVASGLAEGMPGQLVMSTNEDMGWLDLVGCGGRGLTAA